MCFKTTPMLLHHHEAACSVVNAFCRAIALSRSWFRGICHQQSVWILRILSRKQWAEWIHFKARKIQMLNRGRCVLLKIKRETRTKNMLTNLRPSVTTAKTENNIFFFFFCQTFLSWNKTARKFARSTLNDMTVSKNDPRRAIERDMLTKAAISLWPFMPIISHLAHYSVQPLGTKVLPSAILKCITVTGGEREAWSKSHQLPKRVSETQWCSSFCIATYCSIINSAFSGFLWKDHNASWVRVTLWDPFCISCPEVVRR